MSRGEHVTGTSLSRVAPGAVTVTGVTRRLVGVALFLAGAGDVVAAEFFPEAAAVFRQVLDAA